MLNRDENPEPDFITALLFLREGVPLGYYELSWVTEVLSVQLKPQSIVSKWTALREGGIKKNNSLGLEGI